MILLRRFAVLLLMLPLWAACAPRTEIILPTPEEAPLIAEAHLRGSLTQWPNATPIANRAIALCLLPNPEARTCEVQPQTLITDAQGAFEFTGLPMGDYLILIDSGASDFAAAITTWAGQSIQLGDEVWVLGDLLAVEFASDPAAQLNLWGGESLTAESRIVYALDTLMLAGAPFVIAHTLDGETAAPVRLHADQADASATILTILPQPPDTTAIRTSMGALTREESRLLDPALVTRWNAFLSGDDSAYSDGDARVITALRSGTIHLIGDTYLTRVDIFGVELVKGIGYMVYDPASGAPTLVGMRVAETGDVLETSTGYVLNVRDNPGEWLTTGPNGEQFYHFGWSYYQRWRRILPDPLIAIAESFRTTGASNVTLYLDGYRQAAEDYPDGDLTLLEWDESVSQQVVGWQPLPSAPPYLTVPDSGTIDVRRERFYEAVTSGMVQVDVESVVRFLEGDVAQNGFFYTSDVTPQTVVDALLAPYRAGHTYTDFEAALILDATYGGDGPLIIRVTGRIPDGAFVPRDEKQLYFADGEVADVILGYSGTLIARWPHEMGHLLDFRDPRNDYPARPAGGSRCEPFKYMMEYMWWVERFPFDAPDWDWRPVGSGLTLARLLTGTYPNSGC